MARVCPCRRAYDLRQQHHGCLSTGWNLYRSDPEGRKAKRTAGNAADKVRAGDQSQDRQSAGPRSTGEAARPCRRGDRMSTRRAFITLLGGAAAWPFAARAQEQRSPYRIGFLGVLPGENTSTFMKSFLERLNELGYREGYNMIFDYRS